ncbi:MAG: hypothetical protein GXO23_02745 [Crenarchaeota archaeon]|nr:hypothetical protein [Thermoproteota archaeon]
MQETQAPTLPPLKSVHFRLDYIHAERLPIPHSPSQPVNMMFNLNILNTNVTLQDSLIEIPFVVNISSVPSIISVTLKGALVLQFEHKNDAEEIMKSISEGKVPDAINMIIMQYIIFEVSLIMRELGMPPMIPVPQVQAPQKPGDKSTEIHYV